MSYETDRIAALEDLVCQEAIKTKALETALTAAQAAVKRRDEVLEYIAVNGLHLGVSACNCGMCAKDRRNWIAAKLKEVPNDRA
jgi:hypothetical protein